MSSEQQLEEQFIQKLLSLKYEYRPDIRNRAALEANFREKFQALNRVKLTDDEFQRLLDDGVVELLFNSDEVEPKTHIRFFRKKAEFGGPAGR